MRVYSIFDDFGEEPVRTLEAAGISVNVHPLGVPRPDSVQIKKILEEYNGVIIGTSQKLTEDMFENIISPRIIGTASVGLDHIRIPDNKKDLITVFNTPMANAQSVAEYTMGCALACCKRLAEGSELYREGRNNKALVRKPDDLRGKTLGVIGAGNISRRIMEYGRFFGMNIICWTAHPERHDEIKEIGVQFTGMEKLLETADVISVNLPNNDGTKKLISRKCVDLMKDTTIFISVSRLATVDSVALFERAVKNSSFYVCLDIDVDKNVVGSIPDVPNVLITPHIAGGTNETRKRMFIEVARQIANINGGKHDK
ncbi:MAG: hypothetical protein J1G06_01145 [Oscillospiraceae bacterium]|nr:hypothetical protein [Oscillospiraceae bacterium]